jgi:hypothetical protein
LDKSLFEENHAVFVVVQEDEIIVTSETDGLSCRLLQTPQSSSA